MALLLQDKHPLRRWRFLVTAALLLFLSACSLPSTVEKERLAQVQLYIADGESASQSRNYVSARSAYAQALYLSPADGLLAFRLGYIDEKLGNYADAAGVYREALKITTISAELQHDLTYRLALLEAFRLHGEDQIPILLKTLPPASAYAADLDAVLALLAKDGRKALTALNQARTFPLTPEMSSIILYHAARAYYLTGEVDRALQNLYEAINRADNSPISRDIEEFREFLLSRPRS